MRIHIQVSLEYGILFLYDPYGEPEMPADTGVAPITFTDSSVCFQVAAYVDGDANVTLSDEPPELPTVPDFSKRIRAPSNHISLTDVPVNYYSILRLKADFLDIRIWNYISDGGQRTWVQLTGLELF